MSQSLERGIEALFFLSKRKTAGVTEVAQQLGVNKSTAFRILQTLMETNMVVQDETTARYKLGPGILCLSDRLIRNINIISTAKHFMVRLAEATGESVHLCMLGNGNAIVIEQVMADTRLAVHAKMGNSEPLYCSSVGKCLLAYLDEKKRETILAGLEFEKFTKNTITDTETLRGELREVVSRGYALDLGEISEEIMCIAAPVHDNTGAVPYSMGISGPKGRMEEKKIRKLAAEVMQAAGKLSEQLGYFKQEGNV